jgi:hypothetical protein
MRTRLSRRNERAARVGRVVGEAFGRNEVLILSNLWWADGRRAEATCKAWRACRVPVDKARLGYLGAYLARPRRCWQPAGRGHPGFGKRDPTERVDVRHLTTWGRSATLGEQLADLSAEREVARWMARLAARGLPPDWTEEELRRQGHDLDARVEQGHYDSNGHYRPGEDEEAVTPRAAWTAAQTL